MNLVEINFHVYKLGTYKPQLDSTGKMFIQRGEEVLYIDDKTLPYQTLGLRRLYMQSQGVKLYLIKYALYYLKDILKLSNPQTWFVDSDGKIFKYIKSRYAPIKCFPIRKVERIPSGGSIIEVEGVRYKTMYNVDKFETPYAGILFLENKVSILYGVYQSKFEDSRRKI